MPRSNCARCIHRYNCPYGKEFVECNDYESEDDSS